MNNYYEAFHNKGNTYKDIFTAVDAYIRNMPELKDAVSILDYGKLSVFVAGTEDLREDDEVTCHVSTGGSEGVYLDCKILYTRGIGVKEQRTFATYKTLEDDLDAYIKMGMIGGAFTKLAEEYIFLNTGGK